MKILAVEQLPNSLQHCLVTLEDVVSSSRSAVDFVCEGSVVPAQVLQSIQLLQQLHGLPSFPSARALLEDGGQDLLGPLQEQLLAKSLDGRRRIPLHALLAVLRGHLLQDVLEHLLAHHVLAARGLDVIQHHVQGLVVGFRRFEGGDHARAHRLERFSIGSFGLGLLGEARRGRLVLSCLLEQLLSRLVIFGLDPVHVGQPRLRRNFPLIHELVAFRVTRFHPENGLLLSFKDRGFRDTLYGIFPSHGIAKLADEFSGVALGHA
mmetsp:Transcript_6293/g.14565  ORF Transcript_6293/g.14565 Transcript_6293/m.14565 type:complete len:264 (+) Transcript_6293:1065-1856(+)